MSQNQTNEDEDSLSLSNAEDEADEKLNASLEFETIASPLKHFTKETYKEHVFLWKGAKQMNTPFLCR
jgi:hypothetical protein